MSFARVSDGVSISYAVEGSGPLDLILLHGWAGSGDYFAETLQALDTSRVRTVTVDLRGHGQSDAADEFGLDDLAGDVLAVADAVGASSFVLLGFSMSAKFALYVAATAPERVVGLVLVAGCPAAEIPFPPELRADWLGRVGNGDALSALTQQYASQTLPKQILERIGAAAQKVPLAALDGTFDACLTTSFVDRLASVTMPTLVVGGRDDAIFSPDVLQAAVVAPLPQARLAVLGCGHEIPIEKPTELAAVTEAFLAGLVSQAM